MQTRLVDEIGKRYGRLIVIKQAKDHIDGHAKWMCKCDCGKTKVVLIGNLRRGSTQSCGCLAKEVTSKRRRLEYGKSSFNQALGGYKYRSRIKGLSWTLSKTDFQHLTSSLCFWCGAAPSNVSRTSAPSGEYVYNGVDRINNEEGYTRQNSIPCCKQCNRSKNDLTEDQFLEWISKVRQGHKTAEIFALGRRAYE